MTFKYNPLTGELNIFGVKEDKTPEQPQENTGSGFWYYLENQSPVSFSSTNTFIPFPSLTKSWNNTGVELSNTNEFVVPCAGLWIWTIQAQVIPSEASTINVTPLLQFKGANLTPIGGTWTGLTVFNKGDTIQAGFEVSFEQGTPSSVTLSSGILTTYFTLMLLTPSVKSTPSTDSKNTSGTTPNKGDSGNTQGGTSPDNPSNNNPTGNTTITNLLTNFTVSPASTVQYTFSGTQAGTPTVYPIEEWVTSQNQHPLGNGYVTASEQGTWNFSWELPNYNQKDGFSLNIEVSINGKVVSSLSSSSFSTTVNKGDQISFNLVGLFPSSAANNDQVNITLNPNTTSLTAQQG